VEICRVEAGVELVVSEIWVGCKGVARRALTKPRFRPGTT
jgi:hypothetical protein